MFAAFCVCSGMVGQIRTLHVSPGLFSGTKKAQYQRNRAKTKRLIFKEHHPVLSGSQSMKTSPVQNAHESNKSEYKYQGLSDLENEFEYLHGHHPVYSAMITKKRSFQSLYMRASIYKQLSEGAISSPHQTLHTSKENITNIAMLQEIWQMAHDTGLPIVPVNKSKLDRLVNYGIHQGLALESMSLPLMTFDHHTIEYEHKTDNPSKLPTKLWVLVDNVVDPMNIGSLIRSSVFFGVDEILLSTNCSKLSPVVSKASSGAMEFAPIKTVTDIVDLVTTLRRLDWDVIGTACHSDKAGSMETLQRRNNTLLVIGSESRGVTDEILELCTQHVTIFPHNNCPAYIDSLNVSVASAILLQQLSLNIRSMASSV